MSAPSSPSIYIGMLALVPILVFARLSVSSPCIEIGVFWTAVATALLVSLYAWRQENRIRQGGLLLVHCLLAAALVLAVTALTDLSNFTVLGTGHDAVTGLLLGGLLAFSLSAGMAVRSSARYPKIVVWGIQLATSMAIMSEFIWFNTLPEDVVFITRAVALTGTLLAFIGLSRSKQHLTDNQYLSGLSLIAVFVALNSPLSDENLISSLLEDIVLALSGLLFLAERRSAALSPRIGAVFLLSLGTTGGLTGLLSEVMQIDGIVSEIPTFLFTLLIAIWLYRRRAGIPRAFYWASMFSFCFLGLFGLLPESDHPGILLAIVGMVMLFILTTCHYAIQAGLPAGQRLRLPAVWSFAGHAGVFSLILIWSLSSLGMLIGNYGPARLLARFEQVPLLLGENRFIQLALRDEGFWPDELRPAQQDDLPAWDYLCSIRPVADRFSHIIDTTVNEDEDAGLSRMGLGIQWEFAGDSLGLLQVRRQSPAGVAGLVRGDRIQAINGLRVKELREQDALKKLFEKFQLGSVLSLDVQTVRGQQRKVALTVGTTTQDPPFSRIIPVAGVNVGYLYLNGFSTAQMQGIEKFFKDFKKAGVNELVLDLRYNDGGSLGYASRLANLLAGQQLNGKLFARTVHSARYADRDRNLLFHRLPESLHLHRLVVLTTEDTCSASELMINGLKPHMPVYMVGATTCGKPFSMEEIIIGKKSLMPVTARVVNSRGAGHYTTGIRPDIPARDDMTHALGDPREELLKTAVNVLRTARTE